MVTLLCDHRKALNLDSFLVPGKVELSLLNCSFPDTLHALTLAWGYDCDVGGDDIAALAKLLPTSIEMLVIKMLETIIAHHNRNVA